VVGVGCERERSASFVGGQLVERLLSLLRAMLITPGKILLGIICGVLCGATFFVEAAHIFAVRDAPIVVGHVVGRVPIRQFSVPRADLTIRIAETGTEVHARVQRYLMADVPDEVRFHYCGDPAREVFLFEHEENPYWIVMTCWGLSVLLGVLWIAARRSARVGRLLGWKPDGGQATAATR
jgi:hypothetical protein